MPDNIPSELLKKKALERWENEGGRVYTDHASTTKSRSFRKQMDADHAPATIRKRILDDSGEKMERAAHEH